MIRFTLTSALKDLRRRAADPLALVLWLGIPLLVGSLLSLVSGGSGQASRGVVLLADEDNGLLGRVIEGSLQRGPLGQMFEVRRVSAADGRESMQAGEASALLVVPAGATEAFLTRKPLAIALVKNPAQRILPDIVEESADMLVGGGFYVQRVFGAPLEQLNADINDGSAATPSSAQVATIAATFSDRVRAIRRLVFPPVLDFSLEAAPAEGPATSSFSDLGRLFVPGLIFMALLFIAQGTSGDIWEEHRQGTLRRALIAPSGVRAFLMGKVLAGAVLTAAVTLVGLATSVALFDVPVGRAALGLPWAVFGGTVLVVLFMVPQVAAATQRGANMLGSLLVFPLMMMGGSFFPFEAMPAWMAAAGRWTPNGQAVARLKDLLNGTPDAVTLGIAALAMLLPAAASIVFVTARLRRRFAGAA